MWELACSGKWAAGGELAIDSDEDVVGRRGANRGGCLGTGGGGPFTREPLWPREIFGGILGRLGRGLWVASGFGFEAASMFVDCKPRPEDLGWG